MVLQFWKGDRVRSQNTFRRWMLAHNVPRPGGRPIEPMLFGDFFGNSIVVLERQAVMAEMKVVSTGRRYHWPTAGEIGKVGDQREQEPGGDPGPAFVDQRDQPGVRRRKRQGIVGPVPLPKSPGLTILFQISPAAPGSRRRRRLTVG